MIGKRFGRLTVAAPDEKRHNKRRWKLRCDCGGFTVSYEPSLIQGRTKSCGCAKINAFILRIRYGKPPHGMSRSRVYKIWGSMRSRCQNPRNSRYKDYGGRGIYICPQWATFEQFYNDMGDPPSDNHTLDRINNDLGYSPENCRWATPSEQQCNTRRYKIKIVIDGKSYNVAELSRISGLTRTGVMYRIKRGKINQELLIPHTKDQSFRTLKTVVGP